MTRKIPTKPSQSLLERAAEIYDFTSGLKVVPIFAGPEAAPSLVSATPRGGRAAVIIDRDQLLERGFIIPGAPVSSLAEEMQIVKRQILRAVSGETGIYEDKRRLLLVCSAQSGDGKTFCALNLALSLAIEKETEVLLIDGDFNKPDILSTLGIEAELGFVDAISDPAMDAESLIIKTDIPGLLILPAGQQTNNVPELLASQRTRQALAELTSRNPRRIIIFDSPPALVASPAIVMAGHVGQAIFVVRADRTADSDLREAVSLLSACDHISLLLNGTVFEATGRRFGTYYGIEP